MMYLFMDMVVGEEHLVGYMIKLKFFIILIINNINIYIYENIYIIIDNISIDTLNRRKFKEITGHDRLPEILKGIELLQKKGFEKIKINAVLLKDINDTKEEFDNWAEFINKNNVSFRYIELMQTGDNFEYFKKYHQSAKVFKEYIETQGWKNIDRARDDGPALNYINQNSKGSFGVIAPYSKDFCKSCNRLRITAKGELRLCLFGNTGTDLRKYLQDSKQKDELIDLILTLLIVLNFEQFQRI